MPEPTNGRRVDKDQIPRAWSGHRIAAVIVMPGGVRISANYETTYAPNYGTEVEGFLEEANELGIIASFNFVDEAPVRTFYPWSAVLSLRSLA